MVKGWADSINLIKHLNNEPQIAEIEKLQKLRVHLSRYELQEWYNVSISQYNSHICFTVTYKK